MTKLRLGPLERAHKLDRFDSGAEELDGWLRRYALIADAAMRTLQAADLVGARALLVHARDERAAAFYERLGFTRSPTDVLHLMVLVKDLRRTFG